MQSASHSTAFRFKLVVASVVSLSVLSLAIYVVVMLGEVVR